MCFTLASLAFSFACVNRDICEQSRERKWTVLQHLDQTVFYQIPPAKRLKNHIPPCWMQITRRYHTLRFKLSKYVMKKSSIRQYFKPQWSPQRYTRVLKHKAILYNEAEVSSLSIRNPNRRPMLQFDWLIHSGLILARSRCLKILQSDRVWFSVLFYK